MNAKSASENSTTTASGLGDVSVSLTIANSGFYYSSKHGLNVKVSKSLGPVTAMQLWTLLTMKLK
jgi:hypothetical protein